MNSSSRETTTTDNTFQTTRDATIQANELERIQARGENEVTLATTVRPQAPSGPTNEETAARLRLLRGGYTVTPPTTTTPTTATADDAPTSPAVTTPTTTTAAEPTAVTTTAAEPTTVREVSADGTTSTVELENVGAVVPTVDPGEEAGPAIIPEPTAAVDTATPTDFFAQTTADGGDPLATLAELVTQARPDAAANLGDTPTVDQLAGVIDSELELQDERIGQLLNGIRTLETDEVEIV